MMTFRSKIYKLQYYYKSLELSTSFIVSAKSEIKIIALSLTSAIYRTHKNAFIKKTQLIDFKVSAFAHVQAFNSFSQWQWFNLQTPITL